MSKIKVIYVDYRFIVKAKDMNEAFEKIDKFIPEATKDIHYTSIGVSLKK